MKNKIVVVTGGSGVIGKAIALDFIKQNDTVILLDRNEKQATKVAAELTAVGPGKCYVKQSDVLNRELLVQAEKEIMNEFGVCEVLVNCAGGNHPMATSNDEFFGGNADGHSFFDLEEAGIDQVFALNFKGTLLPSQIFGKRMVEHKTGSIINISSMSGFTPLTKIPAYSAAKSAINNFTEWLAVYFSKTGVRVNAVAPGFLATAQNKELLFNEDGSPTARTEKILQHTPMGRFGNPEEVSKLVTVLADESISSFITGVVIPIDGGFSAYSGV